MFKRWLRNEDGNIAINCAILALPLMVCIGSAVDYTRLLNTKQKAQHAADAAALAAANKPELSDGELISFAHNFFQSNISGKSDYKKHDIKVARSIDGTVSVSLDADLKSIFMQVAGYPKLDFIVNSAAGFNNSAVDNHGCVFLTDPKNTGLKMSDNSSFSANCNVMITTKNTAIDINDNAQASFAGICTNGTLSVKSGSLTPPKKVENCVVVVDPFSAMTRPKELNGSCLSNTDINVNNGDDVSLVPGVHCGEVKIAKKGKLTLEPGVHYFKEGLDLSEGGTLVGDDVLVAFNKNVKEYTLSGDLNINGLTTGDYKGFVIYHEDYSGSSNTVIVGKKANFRADGVIYLPNTHIKIYSEANTFATQSIIVTDRFELEGKASFQAKIDQNSKTPLPDNDLFTIAKTPYLIY